jgi:DNA polymerase III delta subunit
MSAARKARDPLPQDQLEALQRELASGKPLARAYLVRGDESYFREAALRTLTEVAARAGLELARHDAGDPDFRAGELCDDLGSASMFAPARCVVVRRANRLLQQEEGEAVRNSAAVEAALAFLRRKDEAGVLLLEGQGLRVDSVLGKAVREAGGPVLSLRKLWETPPPWDPDPRRSELVQWLAARARTLGVELRSEDVVYIAAATGNELAALDAQLDRIKNRGEASLRSVVPWTAGSSPFQVAEELVLGDLPRALSGLEALYQSGFQGKEGRETNANALTAMLLGSLRNKLSATLAALEELPAEASAELKKRLPARTPAEWERFARQVWALERRSRTGAGVDLDQLCAFALRTRTKRPAQPAAAPTRSYR